jgi:hypothetical protein
MAIDKCCEPLILHLIPEYTSIIVWVALIIEVSDREFYDRTRSAQLTPEWQLSTGINPTSLLHGGGGGVGGRNCCTGCVVKHFLQKGK